MNGSNHESGRSECDDKGYHDRGWIDYSKIPVVLAYTVITGNRYCEGILMSKKRKDNRPKTIVQQHAKNFETLEKAFKNDNVALMDCIEKATGEHVAVICAYYRGTDGQYNFVPFAKFFNGNPYELLQTPMEYDEKPTGGAS